MSMRISVIVPTSDRPDSLALCLERLVHQRRAPDDVDYEILVTDDGASFSAKKVVDGCSAASCRWIPGPRRGPAANRNSGAAHASGEWLVFIDDDCVPNGDLLTHYAAAARQNPGCGVFEGRIAADRPKRHPLEECPLNERGGNLWSCNFMISRDLFKKLGGFDELFPHAAGEDWELCHRLKKAGEPIVFLPMASVTHPWRPGTVGSYWRQRGRFLQGNCIAMEIHPELRNYFTVWNVTKDIVRRYAKSWVREFRDCGPAVFLYEPLFLAVQFRRAWTYLLTSSVTRPLGPMPDSRK
jgi:GT2 family glycosyltransferase